MYNKCIGKSIHMFSLFFLIVEMGKNANTDIKSIKVLS